MIPAGSKRPVGAEAQEGGQGPLVGVSSGLSWVDHSWYSSIHGRMPDVRWYDWHGGARVVVKSYLQSRGSLAGDAAAQSAPASQIHIVAQVVRSGDVG